jgi:aspartate/methionine/tyrosine aminotransferase
MPFDAFGSIFLGGDNHVRLSYATSMKNITGGMDRIEEFDKKVK